MSLHAALKPSVPTSGHLGCPNRNSKPNWGDYPQPYRDELWGARQSRKSMSLMEFSIRRRADAKRSDDWLGAWGVPLGAVR
jgi:hypothetical protein